MKKRYLLGILVNIVLVLAGCAGAQSAPLSGASGFAASVSPAVYECLAEEWAVWNAMEASDRLLSSHMPGHLARVFDSWTLCEEFIGFSVSNPLEDCSWLEQANYVGMPNYQKEPRIHLTIHGTEDGAVEQLDIESGYRSDGVRVMLRTTIYDDSPEQLRLLEEQYASRDPITAKGTDKFFANETYRLKDNVLYYFNIVGEPEEKAKVQDTMRQVLEAFSSADRSGSSK